MRTATNIFSAKLDVKKRRERVNRQKTKFKTKKKFFAPINFLRAFKTWLLVYKKMSDCKKCGKILSSMTRLRTHQNTIIPCDKKCRRPDCDFKGDNTRQYSDHMKKHKLIDDSREHVIVKPKAKTATIKKTAVVKRKPKTVALIEPVANPKPWMVPLPNTDVIRTTIISVPPPPFFPLDDFEWEGLIAEDTIMHQDTYADNDDLISERLTRTTKYEKIRIRARNVQAQLTLNTILASIAGLDPRQKLSKVVAQILYLVHTQPDQPQFHTICLTDINRSNMSTWARVAECPEVMRFVAFGKAAVPALLTKHGQNATKMAVLSGRQVMQARYWLRTKQVVMHAIDNGMDGYNYNVILSYKNGDIKFQRMKDDKYAHYQNNIRYWNEDFVHCTEEMAERVQEILKLFDESRLDMFERLDDIELKPKFIDPFLARTRQVCLKSFINKCPTY
jgi:hypothetical protein